MATPKVILLSGEALQREAAAVAAITPGHLLELVSAGVQKNSVEAVKAPLKIADFSDFDGGGIDSDYAADDTVKYFEPVPGTRFYGFLAAGENVAVGDRLVSNGDGTFREYVGTGSTADDASSQLVEAVEAKNNASGATAVRIRVAAL
jgi:hypothetical protein